MVWRVLNLQVNGSRNDFCTAGSKTLNLRSSRCLTVSWMSRILGTPALVYNFLNSFQNLRLYHQKRWVSLIFVFLEWLCKRRIKFNLIFLIQDREKRSLHYIPPAPRPHYVRSAPSQTRLIHSRNDSHDLDNSFHYLMNHTATSGAGNSGSNFFRQFFDIQERIGFGSFGDVYRVKSKVDNKEYAIKKSRRTYSGESDRLVQYKIFIVITYGNMLKY